MPAFCYGDEESGHCACTSGHLTTANHEEEAKRIPNGLRSEYRVGVSLLDYGDEESVNLEGV